MQKDVYAIYESYLLKEDGYSQSSVKLPGSLPRGGVMASANDTSRSVYNGPAPYDQGNANPLDKQVGATRMQNER